MEKLLNSLIIVFRLHLEIQKGQLKYNKRHNVLHVVFVHHNIVYTVRISSTGISRKYLRYPGVHCAVGGGALLLKTYLCDLALSQLVSHKRAEIDKACYNYRTFYSVVIAHI
jgi:hypothetical protein